ncbi:MAG TPA: sigma factor-like helix-turn-helix DNA-binding protein, partial [Gemmataceae bacterium]|nr:sigma factor-like helix-turn-helix DNA-binding protein [Gemmataceae bacterium]
HEAARRFRRAPDCGEQWGWGFVGLCLAADRWRPGSGDFRAYAWSYVVGHVQNALAHHRRHWGPVSFGGGAEGAADRPGDFGGLERLLGGLTDVEREVVHGKVILGLTDSQVAERVGRARTTVWEILKRALARLRGRYPGRGA